MGKERLYYVSIIRVVCVCLIFLCHFSVCYIQYNISGFSNWLLNLRNTDTGKLGVQLFFMISGAVLIYNYKDHISTKDFYTKRFLSLYPLLWFTWIVTFLFKLLLKSPFPWSFNGSLFPIVWSVLGVDYYVGQIVPTYALTGEWFTGAIILIYMLFPLLRYCWKNKYLYPIVTCVLYACYLIGEFVCPLPGVPGSESIIVDIFYFWIGMLFIKEADKLEKIPTSVLLFGIITMLVAPVSLSSVISATIISVLVFLLIKKVPENIQRKVATNAAIKRFEGIAYAFYLLHHQIIYIVMERYKNTYIGPGWGILLLAVTFILIIAVSFICKFIVEKAMQRLSKQMRKKDLI